MMCLSPAKYIHQTQKYLSVLSTILTICSGLAFL